MERKMITTAKALRFHAGKILETTMRGEDVIVTYRGKPTAKIIPFSKNEKGSLKKKHHHLFGIWKDKTNLHDVDGYVRFVRKGRVF
jgi:prevent-host-death family protein